MGVRFRSWWQKIRKPLEIAVIITLGAVSITVIVMVIAGYIFHWDWTGLSPYTSPSHPKDSNFQRGKTLWDWLQLLIIPLVLAVGGYLFSASVSKNEQKSAQLRDQTERNIAEDNQREAALQEYIDRMSELLLEKHLRESEEDAEVRNIGRVRTLTVLRRLDGERRGSVLKFLQESGLINKDRCIINLIGADLRGTDLVWSQLSRAKLNGVNLRDAKLNRTDLQDTDLQSTNLEGAQLFGANLSGADLRKVTLGHANLYAANLSGADLSGASLSAVFHFGASLFIPQWSVDLSLAKLSGASLRGTNLRQANLYAANLSGADLSDADLSTANLTEANLSGADLSGTYLGGADL